MAAALILFGVVLTVVGTALVYWPAAVIVAGALALVAGVDLTTRGGR